MAVPPNYLQPVIGFAMNRLGRGESAEAVLAMLERSPTFGHLPEQARNIAMQFALSNMVAVRQLEITSGRQTMADLLGKIIPTAENVGVRAIARVEGPDGVVRDAGITVNVPPDWTTAQIEALITEQINSGQYRPHTGHDCPGLVVGTPEIIGIYEGGTENANVTVARPA